METRALDRIRFVTRHFNNLQGLRYWVPVGLITLSVGGTTYFTNPPLVALRLALFLGAFLLMFVARRYYRRNFGEVESQSVYLPGELHSLSIFSPAGPIQRLQGFQQMTPIARHFLIIMGLTLVVFSVFQEIPPTIDLEIDESLVEPPWANLDAVFYLAPKPWTVGDLTLAQRGHLWWSWSTRRAQGGQMMYALYGAFFLGIWLWRGRRLSQSYHLALGALLLGLSAFGACLGYFFSEDREIPRMLIDFFLPAVAHLWVALLLCGASMIVAGLLDHWQLIRGLRRPAALRGEA